VFKALGMKERRAGLIPAVREGAVTVDSNGVVVVPVPKRVRVEVVEYWGSKIITGSLVYLVRF
jgi:hypothetical protein